jgi:membrane protein YdbS with pleckstrin-like domain
VPRTNHEREQQRSVGKMQKPSIRWQMTMLTTLVLSIIASRFIDYYHAAINWSPFRDWQYLVFALIISVTIFPLVYRKAQRSQHDPALVQLGVVFAAGIGWEKLLSTTASLVKPLH